MEPVPAASPTVDYASSKRRLRNIWVTLGWQLLGIVALGVMFVGFVLTWLGVEGFADEPPSRLKTAAGVASLLGGLILFVVSLVRSK